MLMRKRRYLMVSKFQLNISKNIETKDTIARTLEIANNYAGELSIEVLPLDKIELDPANHRELSLTLQDALNGIDNVDPQAEQKKQDWKSLESLAKTIRDEQLINPIFVYRYGNKCRLIAGERRTLASAIAGKKEIIARIANQRPVGTKLKILQWVENNERVNLTLSERIASLEAIIKEYFSENIAKSYKERVTARLLSDLTGMSITQSRRYILILESKSEIKQAIIEGKLENIKLIELICSVENLEQQQELFSAALSGQSFESINKLKNEFEVNAKRKKEIRSLKKMNVNLGSVKPTIVKIIFDLLVGNQILDKKVIEQINMIYSNIQWNNSTSLERSFKKMISVFEGV